MNNYVVMCILLICILCIVLYFLCKSFINTFKPEEYYEEFLLKVVPKEYNDNWVNFKYFYKDKSGYILDIDQPIYRDEIYGVRKMTTKLGDCDYGYERDVILDIKRKFDSYEKIIEHNAKLHLMADKLNQELKDKKGKEQEDRIERYKKFND
jgi:hypothetical protein